MNAQKYTQKSLAAIQSARDLTLSQGHQQMEQIHLFSALLTQENGLVPALLKRMDISTDSLLAAVAVELERLPRVTGPGREADRFYISRPVDEALNHAEDLAASMHDDFVSVEHLLLSLLDKADGVMAKLFDTYGIRKEQCLQTLQAVRGSQRVTTDDPEATYEALEKYGTDLVKRAREKKDGSRHRQG